MGNYLWSVFMRLKEFPSIAGVGIKGFLNYRNVYKSEANLEKYQNRKLRKAVYTAYNESEFYRQRFDSHGVHPDDIKSVEDLYRLPVITKKDLAENFEKSVPLSLERERAFLIGTSGSTGKPVRVYKDYSWLAGIWSCALRARKMHKMGIPKVCFILDNESPLNFESTMENYFKLFKGFYGMVNVEDDIYSIMKQVEEIKPDIIFTYTGIMRELAILRKNGLGKELNIKSTWLTGELVDNFTRNLVEDAFCCSCYSLYSSTEGSHMGVECENKNMHVMSDSVIVEIVDEEGNIVEPGQDGRVLITCIDEGLGTPIIRYSGLADVGVIMKEKCSCGLNTPVLGQIKGRQVDSICLPDGKVYHAFSLTIPMEKIQREYGEGIIRNYQIVQYELDLVEIGIVSNNDSAEAGLFFAMKKNIEKTYQDFFGEDIRLRVEEKDASSFLMSNKKGVPNPLVVSMIDKKKKQLIKRSL